MEGYGKCHDAGAMLFMDFRRHHSGVWAGAAPRRVPFFGPSRAYALASRG